jgi:probable HAF family extracellular repeat protein
MADNVAYTIVDLGTLDDGSNSYAYGLNDNGQVVGKSFGLGASHAFLYDGTTMHNLGVLYGENIGVQNTGASGINNGNQIVGWSPTAGFNLHAFLYDGSGMHDLGTLGGTSSVAESINDNGHIVGSSEIASGRWHAFSYDGSIMHDLGTLGGIESKAHSINENGLIVGQSKTTTNLGRAFLYIDSTMHNLGTLGGAESSALDINSSGQIVGWSNPAGATNSRAFFYDGSEMNDIGSLGGYSSVAKAINNSGQVVGWSHIVVDYEQDPFVIDEHAFLYDNGSIIDLNNLIPIHSGWILQEACDINNSGQIVGYGTIDGQEHAFMMTPVPEPATVVLLAVGAGVFRKKAKGKRDNFNCRL